MTATWPVAELDTVARLRILAAAQGGGTYVEGLVDAMYDRVWGIAADLERELPVLLPDVRTMRITAMKGLRLDAYATGYGGLHAQFEIVLEPGWCVMQSRFLIGGMAAVPAGEQTRFAFLGALRLPGIRLLRPALRPLLRGYGPRVLHRLRQRVGAA